MEMQFCCGCAPPIMVDWNRAMQVSGPVTGDTTISGYTNDWSLGSVFVMPGNQWRCMVFGTTPDDTPSGTQGHWNRKMRPMRFAAAVASDVLLLDQTALSESASPFSGSAILNAPKFFGPPASAIGPPVDGHFKTAETSSFSISIPFGAQLNNSGHARFVRLLIDGVDVSGPVAISSPATSTQIGTAFFGCLPSGLSISSAEVASKSIEVDIWFEVDVTLPGGVIPYTNAAVWTMPTTQAGRYANEVPHYLYFVRGINALNINARRAAARKYNFAFSSAIEGGYTSVNSQAGSPWTVTRTNSSLKLSPDGNDYVQLFYGQEIVEVVLLQYQKHGSDIFRNWVYRYMPVDTGHYGGFAPGIFQPAESQTFELVGWNASGSGNFDYGFTHTGGINFGWNTTGMSAVSSFCPATITVGPI